MADLIPEARGHAVKAATLLDALAATEAQVDAMTEDQRLQAIAMGAIKRFNDSARYTVDLATAHALAALALHLTEANNDPGGGEDG